MISLKNKMEFIIMSAVLSGWWCLHRLKAETDGGHTGLLLQESVFVNGCADRLYLLGETGSQMRLSVVFHGPSLCLTNPEDFSFIDTLKR